MGKYFLLFFFLTENALHALTVNVVEKLQEAVAIIGSELKSKEEKIAAINTILNYIDDIDTSIDFCKIGGICVLIPGLTSSFFEVQRMSALLIAELAQNNPYCQKQLLEADILPHLMSHLSEGNTANDALRAISCLIRGYEPAIKSFIDIGGFECLLGCLKNTNEKKMIMRATFLMNSLCYEYPNIKEDLINLGVIEIIIELIQMQLEDNLLLEPLLSILCSLTQCELAKNRVKHEFMKTLKNILKSSKDDEQCRDIFEYSQSLLENMFDKEN